MEILIQIQIQLIKKVPPDVPVEFSCQTKRKRERKMSQRSTTQKRKVVRSPASQQIFDSFLADLDEVDEAGSRLSSPMAESLKADAQTRYRQARETRSRQMLELEEAKVEAAKARLQKVSRSEAGTDSDSDDFEGDAKANRKQAGSRSSKKGSTKSSCNEKAPKRKRTCLQSTPIPKNSSFSEQPKLLHLAIGELPSVVWDSDQQRHQIPNNVPEAHDGATTFVVTSKDPSQGFKVWVACAEQPHEGMVTDYECAICKDAKARGVHNVGEGKVSLATQVNLILMRPHAHVSWPCIFYN